MQAASRVHRAHFGAPMAEQWLRVVLLWLLSPLLWLQSRHVRRVTPHMPEPPGRRAGTSGSGDVTAPLMSNVPILATDQHLTKRDDGKEHSFSTITLEVTPYDADRIIVAKASGRLTALLRQANVEPARPYREMLDTLAGDVRRHLELAARVLADLQPQSRSTRPTARSAP